jgi:hypothetical protein
MRDRIMAKELQQVERMAEAPEKRVRDFEDCLDRVHRILADKGIDLLRL